MPKRTLLACVALSVTAWLAQPLSASAQESTQAFGYRIGTTLWSPEEHPGDASDVAPADTAWYEAISDGEMTVLSGPVYEGQPAKPALLSLAGGSPFELDQELGALTSVWGDDPRLQPGVTYQKGDWLITIDSLKADLQRGDRDREIDGWAAKHYVAEAGLWRTFEYVGEEEAAAASTSREALTSRVELWFAEDLFFDWAPFALPTGAALPLRTEVEGGGEWVWQQLAGQLDKLGLLLRAEMTERTAMEEGEFGWSQDRMGATFIVGLEQVDPSGLDRSVLDLPRLSLEEKRVIESIGLLVGMVIRCGEPTYLSDAEGSNLEAAFSGSLEESVGGRAAFGKRKEEDTFAVALGGSDEEGMSCLFFMDGEQPPVGEHGIVDMVGALKMGAGSLDLADNYLAGYVAGRETTAGFEMLMFFPSSGALSIEESSESTMIGSFSLEGWGFQRTETGSERLEGLTLAGSFEAVSGFEFEPMQLGGP